MIPFEYSKKTKLVFGSGSRERAGELAGGLGKKVLLHYSGKPGSATTAVADAAEAAILAAGASCVKLPGVQPNPRLKLVYEGIRLCRETGVDCILAVGGGSVIDSAKAIAAGVFYSGDVWDFYTGKAAIPEKALPIGSVLTIPAAGSETSDGTVISNEAEQRKLSFGAPCLVPEFAILDPELCLTLPAYQMACGVCDIIAHVLERYFTNTPHTDFIDRLCEATIRSLIYNAHKLLGNLQDVAAWGEIMLAGCFAHNGYLGCGREQDWSSHEIEHEISAIYDIAHGAGLAIVFPAWMEYVCNENLNAFVQFAVRVFDVDLTFDDPEAIAREGIRRFKSFLRELGLPVSFSQAGIPTGEFERMAEGACRHGTLGHFKVLQKQDVINILELTK